MLSGINIPVVSSIMVQWVAGSAGETGVLVTAGVNGKALGDYDINNIKESPELKEVRVHVQYETFLRWRMDK